MPTYTTYDLVPYSNTFATKLLPIPANPNKIWGCVEANVPLNVTGGTGWTIQSQIPTGVDRHETVDWLNFFPTVIRPNTSVTGTGTIHDFAWLQTPIGYPEFNTTTKVVTATMPTVVASSIPSGTTILTEWYYHTVASGSAVGSAGTYIPGFDNSNLAWTVPQGLLDAVATGSGIFWVTARVRNYEGTGTIADWRCVSPLYTRNDGTLPFPVVNAKHSGLGAFAPVVPNPPTVPTLSQLQARAQTIGPTANKFALALWGDSVTKFTSTGYPGPIMNLFRWRIDAAASGRFTTWNFGRGSSHILDYQKGAASGAGNNGTFIDYDGVSGSPTLTATLGVNWYAATVSWLRSRAALGEIPVISAMFGLNNVVGTASSVYEAGLTGTLANLMADIPGLIFIYHGNGYRMTNRNNDSFTVIVAQQRARAAIEAYIAANPTHKVRYGTNDVLTMTASMVKTYSPPSGDGLHPYNLAQMNTIDLITDANFARLADYYPSDNVAPTLLSAVVNAAGNLLTLTFTETGSPPVLPSGNITGFTLPGHTLSSSTRTSPTVMTFAVSPVAYLGESLTLGYSGGNVTDSASVPNALATIVGHSVSNNSTQAQTVTSVSVSPASTMVSGGLTQQFTPTVVVVNSAPQTVTWTSSFGSVNSSGLFTAPAASTAGVLTGTVTATSTWDNSKSGSATVTVPQAPVVTAISVLPANPTVYQGDTQQFTTAVTTINGAPSGVTWTAATGSISGGGLFTPPNQISSPQAVTVRATSTHTPSVYGETTVTVPALPDLPDSPTINLSFVNGGIRVQVTPGDREDVVIYRNDEEVDTDGDYIDTITQPGDEVPVYSAILSNLSGNGPTASRPLFLGGGGGGEYALVPESYNRWGPTENDPFSNG